jgi:hypothetical protein
MRVRGRNDSPRRLIHAPCLGYLTTLLLFVAVIAIIAIAWRSTGINAVLAFWLAYIMTRPLGASTGDWLSQKGNQGLNLGTSMTSYIFLAVIIFFVAFLQIRKPDITPVELANADPSTTRTSRIHTCRIRTSPISTAIRSLRRRRDEPREVGCRS